jgi:hypothetical protein
MNTTDTTQERFMLALIANRASCPLPLEIMDKLAFNLRTKVRATFQTDDAFSEMTREVIYGVISVQSININKGIDDDLFTVVVETEANVVDILEELNEMDGFYNIPDQVKTYEIIKKTLKVVEI